MTEIDNKFNEYWQLLCFQQEKELKSQLLTQKLSDNETRELIGGLKVIERMKSLPERQLKKSQRVKELGVTNV